MLLIRFILLFFVVAVFGCNKDDNRQFSADGLNGRWKMTAVLDKGPATNLDPPPGSEGKVFLQINGNSFSGETMRNTISNGIISLNKGDSITFGSFSMTQIAENQWGGALLTMLSSCMLQSMHPCRPSIITWRSPRRIEINTAMRYTITLEKF
ncbi:MAG: hypothetical protein EOO01_12405 [Chitinophagaceae bacterium]|nr:MAG: hypothetical protein EOO01_12405 [Chitinophagaceae bacterium]